MPRGTLTDLRRRHGQQERSLVLTSLEAHGWYVTRAATALGISERHLRGLIDQHGLREIYDAHGRGRGRPPVVTP